MEQVSRENTQSKPFDITEAICMLIQLGHVGVFTYSYGFFKTALRTIEKQQKMQALSIVYGVSACFDKKVLDDLMRDLSIMG